MKRFTLVTHVFTLKTLDCHLQACTAHYLPSSSLCDFKWKCHNIVAREIGGVALQRNRNKLTHDDENKTLQYFNKQRKINLKPHAKRRYIHGTVPRILPCICIYIQPKAAVVSDVTSCSFGGMCAPTIRAEEDGDSRFLRNVCDYLPDYTAQ
jgi:hypothetical protein